MDGNQAPSLSSSIFEKNRADLERLSPLEQRQALQAEMLSAKLADLLHVSYDDSRYHAGEFGHEFTVWPDGDFDHAFMASFDDRDGDLLEQIKTWAKGLPAIVDEFLAHLATVDAESCPTAACVASGSLYGVEVREGGELVRSEECTTFAEAHSNWVSWSKPGRDVAIICPCGARLAEHEFAERVV